MKTLFLILFVAVLLSTLLFSMLARAVLAEAALLLQRRQSAGPRHPRESQY